jgi:hypothetical protein
VSRDRKDHIEIFFKKYKAQFPTNIMLKDKIRKNQLEKAAQKKLESTTINVLNLRLRSWDRDEFIESILKKTM